MSTRGALALLLLLAPVTPSLAQVAAEFRFAQVNQTSLRFQDTLTGRRTVVLLHEMGTSLESWDAIVAPLARSHRVLRYDLRGFGLSEKLRGAVTIEDHVEDLRALLDAQGIAGPVTLVGGAVGAAVALRFAALYPERAEALMAISPAVGVASENRAASLASAARLERVGMRVHVDTSLEDVYPAVLRAGNEARVARFLALQYASDPASVAATQRMIAITEWQRTLPAVQCPAWIVATDMYAARPPASLRPLAEALPKGRFELLHTGHFVALQSPELLLPLLDRFLAATNR